MSTPQIGDDRLLSLVLVGYKDVHIAHGYVLQHLIQGELSGSALPQRMDISQQAASKKITDLVNLGYVEYAKDSDARARPVRISKKG